MIRFALALTAVAVGLAAPDAQAFGKRQKVQNVQKVVVEKTIVQQVAVPVAVAVPTVGSAFAVNYAQAAGGCGYAAAQPVYAPVAVAGGYGGYGASQIVTRTQVSTGRFNGGFGGQRGRLGNGGGGRLLDLIGTAGGAFGGGVLAGPAGAAIGAIAGQAVAGALQGR